MGNREISTPETGNKQNLFEIMPSLSSGEKEKVKNILNIVKDMTEKI